MSEKIFQKAKKRQKNVFEKKEGGITKRKMKKINIRKIFEEIEKAKKVVIIEDSEIRELFAYFISKRYPEKKNLHC